MLDAELRLALVDGDEARVDRHAEKGSGHLRPSDHIGDDRCRGSQVAIGWQSATNRTHGQSMAVFGGHQAAGEEHNRLELEDETDELCLVALPRSDEIGRDRTRSGGMHGHPSMIVWHSVAVGGNRMALMTLSINTKKMANVATEVATWSLSVKMRRPSGSRSTW